MTTEETCAEGPTVLDALMYPERYGFEVCPHSNGCGSYRSEAGEDCTKCGGTGLVKKAEVQNAKDKELIAWEDRAGGIHMDVKNVEPGETRMLDPESLAHDMAVMASNPDIPIGVYVGKKKEAEPPRYTHTLDMCFSVKSDKASWEELTAAEIMEALEMRVRNLKLNEPEVVEAVGLVDTIDLEDVWAFGRRNR